MSFWAPGIDVLNPYEATIITGDKRKRGKRMTDNPLVFAIDFDGTLCENKYPDIGEPIQPIIDFCKTMKADGHKLILWTCREGGLLWDAIVWCAHRGLTFDAHNKNLPERIEQYGTDPRKIGADFYVDDRNLSIKELM